eukprot:1703288-Rhodomonas_salina.1
MSGHNSLQKTNSTNLYQRLQIQQYEGVFPTSKNLTAVDIALKRIIRWERAKTRGNRTHLNSAKSNIFLARIPRICTIVSSFTPKLQHLGLESALEIINSNQCPRPSCPPLHSLLLSNDPSPVVSIEREKIVGENKREAEGGEVGCGLRDYFRVALSQTHCGAPQPNAVHHIA